MQVSIKAMRVHNNFTQKQVVDELEKRHNIKMSVDTLKAIECNHREIRVTEFDALCDIYRCSREDIFLPYNSPKSEIVA